MRQYILTEYETGEIKNYLETDESTHNLIVLRGRINKHLPRILHDLKLIQELLNHRSAPSAKVIK